jgi:CHASE3 domain sensor protein
MKAARKIIAPLAGAALLVALVVAASFWAFGQIEEAAGARKHTNAVIHCADALMSELRDAETSQRGYSLTGDETFLEPYLAVRDSIVFHLEQLRSLSVIIDAQGHLDALVPFQ